MFERLFDALLALPAAAVYGVVAVMASLENIIPPIPADTAVAFGAFLSKGGTVSALGVFLATWVANVASAVGVYLAARRVGRPFFQGPVGHRLLKPWALRRVESWYERYGSWGIFVSRFVPGARAVVPPFAGVAGLSAPRTIIPMAAASGIWYGGITWLAATVVQQADDIALLLSRLNVSGLIALGVVLGAIAFLLIRKWLTGPASRM